MSAPSLISIQQEYIDAVNLGHFRWGHRPNGGHLPRIKRAAHRKLEAALGRLGYTPEQAHRAIRDAADMAALERLATTE